ncbi:hypothetical protein CHS0354_012003 [Potamilus streckersoni]|uniref:Uncharacterized protein n=1 Tax=Potamilus streckersoni TaxID=2493646 RepID=A0AAE0SBA7_9BIVA|nr:hypothetical protein CHS0354_012003 [Potamilus streckersoni]
MKIWPVPVPSRSYRRSILKRKEVTVFFPSIQDIDDIPRPKTPEVIHSIHAPKDTDSATHSKTPPPEPQSHWSQWPDPGEPNKRPHTSLGFADLSKEKGKDRPLTPDPSYAYGQKEHTDPGLSMTYIPALKTWINANNDYQRAVVDKMLSSMNRERTFHHYQPSYGGNAPRDSYTYFNPRPTNPYAANHGYYSNNGYSFSRYGSREDDGVIRGMGIKLGEREPLPSIYSKRMEGVKFNRRTKQLPKSEDYVHELSMFMTTQPRVSGHFIIHPDWVSERMSLRRSHTMFEPRKSSKEGLRYTSF